MPCAVTFERRAGAKTDNAAVREALQTNNPLVVFGSYNERMYLAESGAHGVYIPASFPGSIIRRHTGTPFMGYGGATYVVQEFCNALFDALFNILPLGTQMDKGEATPAAQELRWQEDAQQALEDLVAAKPVLIRISASKQLRDAAESVARKQGLDEVTLDCLEAASGDRAAA